MMGLLLGFSFLITLIVLSFQLSIFAGGLILLCLFVTRFVPLANKEKFIRISIGSMLTTTAILFIGMLWSYGNYIVEAALPKAPMSDTALNRYWKENLGTGTIGTVSFMNPILRPILYLVPRTSDQPKAAAVKNIDRGSDGHK